MDYQQVTTLLQEAYNRESAGNRNQAKKEDWKVAERQDFLDLLQREGKQTLLEVGAGTGTDGLFFQQQGLRVVCTDLSPAMVELCREKGLEAHVMDFLGLDFPPASFDAIYALNCLLHVPTKDLPSVLEKLRDLLRPGGLFFLGVYGGNEQEGVREEDWHKPPRFFAHHTDEFMREAVSPVFEIVSFKSISITNSDWRFQSLVLRRKQ
ncbi:class I SAM-dependent methyltransferase [Ktedonobacter racemifer]|uniref:Methyltransferase type 11 n=1 Tax=Ktedonobacter racemifer DSM 44963 TaxID=485913 RepID=D6TTQ1_KTERA|nr:class I SAM-dependent methyltransferase [Ktedonobacter racemifer]EFH83802.1 Methyltransferase type 11 [Ktedonobacter racemifer DSM 44963]